MGFILRRGRVLFEGNGEEEDGSSGSNRKILLLGPESGRLRPAAFWG